MAIYSEFSHKKMVMFHSYVKLPEGNIATDGRFSLFLIFYSTTKHGYVL